MSKILITIGITAHREGSLLKEAWESVINQSDSRWKAILVLDGKSDKKTEEIFQEISHFNLVKTKLAKKQGPYFTRTLAIKNSDTLWYVHLDGDDRLPKDTVVNILQTIKKFPQIEFIIGLSEPTGQQLSLADMNYDGLVNVFDVVLLMEIFLFQ